LSKPGNIQGEIMNIEQGIVDEFWKIVLADNGDHTLQFLDELLASNQNDASVWLKRGVLLEKIGNDSEAMESFTKAIQLGSGDDLWMAFLGRTLLYYNLKNFRKSLDDCEQAIELNPNEAVLWKTKGVLLFHLDKNVEALEAFQKSLLINPYDRKAIELRDSLAEALQDSILKKMEGFEELFYTTFNDIIEELKERWKYSDLPSEMSKSDEFLTGILNNYDVFIKLAESGFEVLSKINQMTDSYCASYYHIKAIKSGLDAVYPVSNQEKMEESRNFFIEANKFAEKSQDQPKLVNIAYHQKKLEERNNYELNKIKKQKQKEQKSKLKIVLGIAAFGVVLVLGGQYLIALICFGAAWWVWQL
jgi:tetratricopeptide (TPR) repeat protein